MPACYTRVIVLESGRQIYYHFGQVSFTLNARGFYHSASFLVVSYLRKKLVVSRKFYTWVTYLLPRNPHIPQLPQLISWGSKSFRSHLRLRKRFSPGSIKRSISPPTVFFTQSISLSMSYWVYPVTSIGTFVSRSCGIVSSHSCELAGCPRPGWKSIKQSGLV